MDSAPASGRRPPAASAGAIRGLWTPASRRTPPRRFWSETWVAGEALLAHLTARLERTREVRTVETDDGWQADRDISVGLNRWLSLHLRVLVEEHREGRCLVRLAQRLRATPKLWLAGACLAGAGLAGAAAGPTPYWPWLAGAATLLAAWAARTLRRSARAAAAVDEAIADTAGALGLLPLPDAPAREEARGPGAEPTETGPVATEPRAEPAQPARTRASARIDTEPASPRPQTGDVLASRNETPRRTETGEAPA